MRILAIADEESRYFWDFYEAGKLDGIDLILSAGDLHPHYLSFLATFANVPVLYVHGNHDDKYEEIPPDGCTCIEDMIYEYKGIRILGLGGSMRYKPGINQYTEKDMQKRVRKLYFKLKKSGGFDILLTHSPAYHINDDEDLAHNGFQAFIDLMKKYRPKYFVHGHLHKTYGRKFKKYDKFGDTHIINAYETCIFDYEAEDVEHNLRKY